MSMSLARLRTALLGPQRHPQRAMIVAQPRALYQAIPTPPRAISRFEDDVREGGTFSFEGTVTDWGNQPGTQVAKLDIQSGEMNAAMQGAGQTNATLHIPVEVASYIPPRARVRLTVEVL